MEGEETGNLHEVPLHSGLMIPRAKLDRCNHTRRVEEEDPDKF